jgi:phospholipid transport system substrate-binding protein
MTAHPHPTRRSLPFLGAALAVGLAAAPTTGGAQEGAARAVVEGFHATLLGLMQQARALGVRGRFDRLRPAMEGAFDLAAMARIAVGPAWTGFTPPQQQAVAAAFSEWSVATYASRFNGFSGESFATSGQSQLRNGDTMVRTVLNRPNGDPVQLNYLLRGAPPRIVDVYLTGTISELASRRADFAGVLAQGGADRLVAELRQRTAGLLAG